MTKILTLTFTLFSVFSFGQNRTEIISILKEYSENIGKQNYNHEFVDEKLNPSLVKLEEIVCENKDKDLFEYFLNMLIASSGSANETPADVLGGIFICQTDLVEYELKGKYKLDNLLEYLSFGFENRTFQIKNKISNYTELKLRLKEILQ